jgi:hypothetical protein
MGRLQTERSVWNIVKESSKAIGLDKLAPHDLPPHMRSPLPRFGRRTRVDPVPSGPLSANDGTLSWLQAANSIRGQ